MPYLLHTLSALLAALSLTTPAHADEQVTAVSIETPYVRAVPPGQPNSAAFMRITNTSTQARALVAARSSAAETTELHSHTMDGGMMRMRQIERIALPPGEQVALEPGGLHMMLIGLKEQLRPGDTIAMTLVFDDDSIIEVEMPIERIELEMGHGPKSDD